MTAALEHAQPEPAPAASPSEALYFPADAPRLFGWLHRPARATHDLGVVICKPFGYEALCGHRSLRAFAEMAAAAGVPALRFDYRGSGDAADTDPDAEQIQLWGEDLLAAIAELRRILTSIETENVVVGPATALLFKNDRVLHGRSAFRGERWLQRAYFSDSLDPFREATGSPAGEFAFDARQLLSSSTQEKIVAPSDTIRHSKN